MSKVIKVFFTVLVLGISNLFAQSAYTPKTDSAERKAILAALRIPVEKELKEKIQFSVDRFKVKGNWAFLNGEPQNSKGKTPSYKNTKYEESVRNGMFDNNFQALLKKTNGKWKVVIYQIGCLDVCWFGWDKKYKAPSEIFPPTD